MYAGKYHADGNDYYPGSDEDDQAPGILPTLGIYVLKYGDAGPDEMAGAVVAAHSPHEARKMAALVVAAVLPDVERRLAQAGARA
jgi:hypothetical protein